MIQNRRLKGVIQLVMQDLFKKTAIVLLFVFTVIGYAKAQYPPHHFSAYIVQDGKRLSTYHQVVKVKRKPFEIVVDMPDKEGVFVSIAFNRKTYNKALENGVWQDLLGFKNPALPELWGNPEKELLVSDFSPYYWYIESRLKNKFSGYDKINNRYVCSRTVDVLYDVDVHKQRPLETIGMSLYFTFIKFRVEEDNARAEELMRHHFKIQWID